MKLHFVRLNNVPDTVVEAAVSKAQAHQLGGTGKPAQAVVRASRGGLREVAISKARTHQPWGTGSPAQGVVGAS